MVDPNPIQPLDIITGRSFLAIQSVLASIPDPTYLSNAVLYVVRGRDEQAIILREEGGTRIQKAMCFRDGSVTELTDQEVDALVAPGLVEKSVEKIEGTSFLAVQAAASVYLNRAPHTDPADYNVRVLARGASIIVIFKHKNVAARARGGPGFEVELSSADRSVIRSHFLR